MGNTQLRLTATASGWDVQLFEKKMNKVTLQNDHIQASFIEYGAALTQLDLIRGTARQSLVLGYLDASSYKLQSNPYFGAIVGRSCNRTSRGKFGLAGSEYQLAINNGPNNLHGGIAGLDKQIWTANKVSESELEFSFLSPNMQEGYPGTVFFTICYSLVQSSLKISFNAKLIADAQETYVNLTAHSYFNLNIGLNGCQNILEDHQFLMHDIDSLLEINDVQIPTGRIILQKDEPEMFFTEPSIIGDRIHRKYIQSTLGYDHFYFLNSPCSYVSIFNKISGIGMKVTTDARGFQFYSTL